jgi:hypothetical protein
VNVDRAVEDVLEAEHDLADELRRVGERHAVDSGVYHVAETRAVRCADNARLLEPHAGRYGVDVRALGDGSGTLERVRRMASEVLGKSDVAGMLLLTDPEGSVPRGASCRARVGRPRPGGESGSGRGAAHRGHERT